MALKDEGTCSICGKTAPRLEMSVNKAFEEERCRECMERYGGVPLETLRAALSYRNMDITKLNREDRDFLIALQKEKIAMIKKSEERIEKAKKSKIPFGRDKKIEGIEQDAKEKRAEINKEIDDYIQVVKAEMEAGGRKPAEQ